ncbi:MAG: RNB domain-containing ribonuclease [Victivallales bacterium]|nr:RNB domain-containing ribonuclease [Victivallales bacterium]
MGYAADTILDYISGNGLCLGTVIKDGDGRVQVKSVTQETCKLAPRQILVSHGVPSGDVKHALVNLQNSILEEMENIDTGLIWEIFADDPGDKSVASISENYYGDKSPVHISALARKLVLDMEHFQRIQGEIQNIRVRSREECEEFIRLRQLRAERTEKRERAMAWIEQALAWNDAGFCPVPEEYEGLISNATDYIMCGTNSDTVNLLSRMADGQKARNNAIMLLKKTGRMPEDADEFLLANGIHAAFPKSVMEYAESLSPDFDESSRKHIEGEFIFSIDDEETREIDDALSCRRDGDEFIVGVYIADPACYVSKDDPLDEVAAERPLSLYLPTTTVKMFPDHLSCDIASLRQGVPRPALAFTLRMTGEGEILDWDLSSAVITVNKRLTYIEADEMIEKGDDDLAESLRDLLKIADESRKFREEDGAVVLNRPELRVRVSKDGEITVAAEDQEAPSHRMVAEFMVLANHVAARFALRNEIPVIYNVQDPPSSEVHSMHKYEPYYFDQQVRKMKRTRLSTYPQPHFGLGLDLYIKISSPLRRYGDLVMHRQLAAKCAGRPLPYTQEELFVVLENVERNASQNKALEHEADKYWLLEYIRRNCIGKRMGATVMKVEGSVVLAELDYYCERGVVMTRDRPSPGEHIKVIVKDAIPNSGRLILQRD